MGYLFSKEGKLSSYKIRCMSSQCSQLFPFLSVDFGLPTSRTQVATLASFLAQRALRKLIQGKAVFRYFFSYLIQRRYFLQQLGVGDCIFFFMIMYDFCLFFDFFWQLILLWQWKSFLHLQQWTLDLNDFLKMYLTLNVTIFTVVIRRCSVLNRKEHFSFLMKDLEYIQNKCIFVFLLGLTI